MNYAHTPTPAAKEKRPGRFAHILLQTPRFEQMVPFYKTLLSASAMFENEIACFMRLR